MVKRARSSPTKKPLCPPPQAIYWDGQWNIWSTPGHSSYVPASLPMINNNNKIIFTMARRYQSTFRYHHRYHHGRYGSVIPATIDIRTRVNVYSSVVVVAEFQKIFVFVLCFFYRKNIFPPKFVGAHRSRWSLRSGRSNGGDSAGTAVKRTRSVKSKCAFTPFIPSDGHNPERFQWSRDSPE